MVPLLQGLLIGFFGTGLYVAVDTYEPDRTVAFVLKCLAVKWGDAAVIHCTGLFGLGFFLFRMLGPAKSRQTTSALSCRNVEAAPPPTAHLECNRYRLLFAAFLHNWLYVFGVV
jgi:hypothetical protein